jgi:cytochrome b561
MQEPVPDFADRCNQAGQPAEHRARKTRYHPPKPTGPGRDMPELTKFSATAKWLHWIIAVIVIIMLLGGQTLESLPLSEREQIIMVHSGLGTLVLLLMIVRWYWRLNHEVPSPISTMGPTQIRLAKLMHWGLYVLLVLQPIFGISQAMFITDYQVVAFGILDYSSIAADDEGLARVFHVLHGLNATIIMVLVIGHIGAGLYHHFVQKDDVLRRMWPGGRV